MRVLESVASAPVLLVLNYHRIGDPAECPYDPGTYSATAEQFDAQITYLARRFRIVSLPEALEVLVRGTKWPAILITFDDGYLDNYELAFPILKSHSTSGTFFLPTSLVGTDRVPWWDAIAYMLRNSRHRCIQLSYLAPLQVDLGLFRPALRTVLSRFKSPAMRDEKRFLEELASATGVEVPQTAQKPLFMSWNNVKEMAAAGMDFGSHTHSHQLLAKLPPDRQLWELVHSRECIRRHAGLDVTTLAFPVGGRTTFSEETQDALAQAGYRGAFSFYGGVNIPKHTTMFNIHRNGVTPDCSMPRLRWRVNSMIAGARRPALVANSRQPAVPGRQTA
jgi:peptidoglycan/xylan/chitin deacetylase (PgdA/CDA1 family)